MLLKHFSKSKFNHHFVRSRYRNCSGCFPYFHLEEHISEHSRRLQRCLQQLHTLANSDSNDFFFEISYILNLVLVEQSHSGTSGNRPHHKIIHDHHVGTAQIFDAFIDVRNAPNCSLFTMQPYHIANRSFRLTLVVLELANGREEEENYCLNVISSQLFNRIICIIHILEAVVKVSTGTDHLYFGEKPYESANWQEQNMEQKIISLRY
ncbi:hypothetical protein V6N11_070579 [Hibiscus sabdariffa]|uniref:C2H2-type domain-containing protein n=1 Tax=Hibiscus sabdariffa TaxID=183260 RepID=A0ABR2QFG2_9ROSI